MASKLACPKCHVNFALALQNGFRRGTTRRCGDCGGHITLSPDGELWVASRPMHPYECNGCTEACLKADGEPCEHYKPSLPCPIPTPQPKKGKKVNPLHFLPPTLQRGETIRCHICSKHITFSTKGILVVASEPLNGNRCGPCKQVCVQTDRTCTYYVPESPETALSRRL